MSHALLDHAASELAAIREAGLWKRERAISSPQGGNVVVAGDAAPGAGGHNSGGVELLNLCANNYLGLADHPRLIGAAKAALDTHGFGMASVRFICGTQDLHIALEQKLAGFLRMEDAILFSSCFDANGGVFEALLGEKDAIISDALNHASIIDGVRLCKARRLRYANNDMAELEARLIEARDARSRLIVTDGVFSMDGIIANLGAICDLAERHDALVMVDDSHAVGFIGARGAGTPERCGVEGRVHLLSGTFGKALGGASGGYIAGPKPFIDLLRQRARPYLFSNALAPSITAATIEALDLIAASADLRDNLTRNAAYFRQGLSGAGFTLTPGEHPIIPVMIGDAAAAVRLAGELQQRGVYVTAFSYPVVPHGKARIRTQMNAAHSLADLDRAIGAFTEAGRAVGLIG
jgi:glycine C-acetyltransferase